MKLGSYLITFMVGLAGASTFAKAEETKLIFTTLSPPTARIAKEWLEPWANRVNERGKGVVSLDIRHGLTLANFGNVYDRVQNDVVQISFALQTAIGGKFPATEVLTLPIWDDHEKAAVAFWKVYKAGGLGAEYDDIVPLFMSPTTQASLHFSKQPRTLDDLKGIKIMVASKLTGQMVSAAGGTPLSIPLGEVYEALQRGTVDGAALGWTSFEPFKLGEVTKFHANVRAGASANMVFMSKKRFNALSPEARKILLDNSGEAASRAAGKWWAGEVRKGMELALAAGGHIVLEVNDQQRARWRDNERVVVDEWVKAQPGRADTLRMFEKSLAEN